MSGHCKAPSHLQVLVTPAGPCQRVTATYSAKMACENHATSAGVVLSHKIRKPLEGMHLLPEACVWMPGQLRDHAGAAGPGETVTISHTSQKIFVHFATLTRADALTLADAIDREAP